MQGATDDSEEDKPVTPAASILQSTERVANVIVSTLLTNKNSFTISKPNLGAVLKLNISKPKMLPNCNGILC